MSTETPRAYVALALRRDQLVERLETGWAMCEEEADPVRKATLEAHWAGLLRAYEDVDTRLVALEVGDAPG